MRRFALQRQAMLVLPSVPVWSMLNLGPAGIVVLYLILSPENAP